MANRQDVEVHLFYGGVWNTHKAYGRGPYEITRGEQNEGSLFTPSNVTILLDDRAALLNPQDPMSPLYADSGQNTPCRIRFLAGLDLRMVGEVASWKHDQSPDFNPVTGRGDRWAEIEVTGILRRQTANEEPLPSTLRAFVESQPGVLTYFTGEDGTDATAPSDAVAGGRPAAVIDVGFGADDALPASAGVMTFRSADSSFKAPVKSAPLTGFISSVLLFKLAAVPASVFELFRIECNGTAAVISIAIDSVAFGINISNASGSLLVSSGPAQQVDETEWVALHIGLAQNGSNVDWAFYRHQAETGLIFGTTGSYAGTLGRATRMVMDPAAGRAGAKVAHWAVTNQAFPFVTNGMRKAVAAYAGYETVPLRMARVCDAAGVSIAITGTAPELLGAQRAGQTWTDVMEECVRTDGGIFRESRTSLQTQYWTRRKVTSVARGAAALTLDWAAGDVGIPTLPVTDDQKRVNDVTAHRARGGSARATLESGRLSVLPPPAGIGRYPKTLEVNPADDLPLPGIASWAMQQSTVAGARFPVVTVYKASLLTAAAAVNIGDRIEIVNTPRWVSPDPVSLIVIGIKERLETHRRVFSFNCVPARGWEVGVWGTSKWGSSVSTTTGAITTGVATSVSVLVAAGGRAWTTAGPFPIDLNLAGARVRCTAIGAPAAGVQVFTISAVVVNGINKIIPAGTPVQVWKTQLGRWGR